MTGDIDVYSKHFGMWLRVVEVTSSGYFYFHPADKPDAPLLLSRTPLNEFRRRRKAV